MVTAKTDIRVLGDQDLGIRRSGDLEILPNIPIPQSPNPDIPIS
jgi:hypothetical protein